MYKNFKLTEEEKSQILEMHQSHGYKKSINELDDRDIDIIRGRPKIKTRTGRPSSDYLDSVLSARQFEKDFKKDYPDPSEDPIPFWEKDKPKPSADSEIEADIRAGIKQLNRDLENKKPVTGDEFRVDKEINSSTEKLIKLRKKLDNLENMKKEFGPDEDLDNLIKKVNREITLIYSGV